MNAESFTSSIKEVIAQPCGRAHRELYLQLAKFFSEADSDCDGMISVDDFDGLVEATVHMPRRFGLAPANEDLYISQEQRIASRTSLFHRITGGSKTMTLPQFVQWVMAHIKCKIAKGVAPWRKGEGKLSLIQPKTPEEFISFLQSATSSKQNPEYEELYFHLLRCFTDADAHKQGVISVAEFDQLIDIAAAAPRKYGFAPSACKATWNTSRELFFEQIDIEGTGTISFDKFLAWAYRHIKQKASGPILERYEKNDRDLGVPISLNLPFYDDSTSSSEFARFCTVAMKNKQSEEYKQLYYHLLFCFSYADVDHSGLVSGEAFDVLIDIAASAPRKFGFAPHASSTFESETARMQSRRGLLAEMDTANNGYISFEDFLAWSVAHIEVKVAGLSAG